MRRLWWLAALLIVLTATAGCTGATQDRLQQLEARVAALEKEVAELRTAVQTLSQQAGAGGSRVTIYLRARGADVLVPVNRSVPPGADLPGAAVRALLAGPLPGEDLDPPVPGNVELRSLRVEGGVATADFSSAITRMNVGSMGEALAVAAIVNTLTEFADIRSVQILVEGRKVETLAGHVDVSAPLERNERLIRR